MKRTLTAAELAENGSETTPMPHLYEMDHHRFISAKQPALKTSGFSAAC
jgi:hypothetical protein